jgi:hypothetical protein
LRRPPDDATVVARARNSHLISEVAAASGSRANAEEGAMAEETLENRLATLEQTVEQQATVRDLEALQAALSSQILQLGSEMRAEFSALRGEIRAGNEETRGLIEGRTAALLAVVAAESRETRQHARTLHEDVIERIKIISRG